MLLFEIFKLGNELVAEYEQPGTLFLVYMEVLNVPIYIISKWRSHVLYPRLGNHSSIFYSLACKSIFVQTI